MYRMRFCIGRSAHCQRDSFQGDTIGKYDGARSVCVQRQYRWSYRLWGRCVILDSNKCRNHVMLNTESYLSFVAYHVNGKESRGITLQNARKGITHLCMQLR